MHSGIGTKPNGFTGAALLLKPDQRRRWGDLQSTNRIESSSHPSHPSDPSWVCTETHSFYPDRLDFLADSLRICQENNTKAGNKPRTEQATVQRSGLFVRQLESIFLLAILRGNQKKKNPLKLGSKRKTSTTSLFTRRIFCHFQNETKNPSKTARSAH